jgi:hypothetical protein
MAQGLMCSPIGHKPAPAKPENKRQTAVLFAPHGKPVQAHALQTFVRK